MRFTIKNISDWYFLIGDSATQVFSTYRGEFVPLNDATYAAWISQGNVVSKSPSNQDTLSFLIQYCMANSNCSIDLYPLMTLQQAQQYKIQSLNIAYNTNIQQPLIVNLIYGNAANVTAGTPTGAIINLPYDEVLATVYNDRVYRASLTGYTCNFTYEDPKFGRLNYPFTPTDWTALSSALSTLNANVVTQKAYLSTLIIAVNAATTSSAVQAVTY